MAERKQIRLILDESTVLLCTDLDPSAILRVLKTKHVINDADEAQITSKVRDDDRVDEMLKILKKRSAKAYYTFMEALREDREDLHDEIKEIEAKHGLGGQRERDIPDAKVLRAELRASCPARRVVPDGDGLYEHLHVIAASTPTQAQLNPDKCYTTLLKAREKGRAYILNVMNFSSRHRLRLGSDIDFHNVKHLFSELGYQTIEYVDLSAQDITTTIDEFVSQFTSEHGSSVVVLMSHGDDGFIFGEDGRAVAVQTIVDKFKPKHCPALSDKPKLFFIQACRGTQKEGAHSSELAVDSASVVPEDVDVPDNADIYLAFATTEGFLSLRNTVAGSWFVQGILEAFLTSAHEESLHQLMNQVTNRVSKKKGFEFYDQETNTMKKIRQTPQIKHSLRKDVYFFPKYYAT